MMAFAPLSPALPHIAEAYSNSPNIEYLTKMVLTAPSLGIIILAPFVGVLIDFIGRKKVLLFSIILYGFSGISAIWINSIEALLLSRLLIGFSLSGIMTSSTALAGDYFQGEHRQKFIGQRGAFVNYSAVCLNIIGGLLVLIDWKAVFFIFLTGFIMYPFTYKTIKDDSKNIIKSKLKQSLNITKLPIFLICVGLILNFFFNSAFFMVPVQMPFLLKDIGQPNPFISGLTTGVSAAAVATASLFFFKLRKKLKTYQVFILGILLVALGFTFLSRITIIELIYPCIIISGAGFGLLQANMFTWMLDITPSKFRGRISGAVAMTTFSGQFFSPIMYHPFSIHLGNQEAFIVFALLMFAISIFVYSLKNIM